MKAVEFQEEMVLSDEVNRVNIDRDESGYTLNIVGIYQDMLTRYWAMQTCHWATQFAREGRVQNQWFNVNSLNDPGIFADAVRAALAADVIVVSVHAADELPPDLRVWFEAWLPRRPTRVGALSALIGVAEPLDSQSVRTLDYLQAVARKGQLDFIPQERRRPVAPPASSFALITEPAGATAQALQKRCGPRYDAYYHWGLNE
ncbi:MAG: hypothetical protein ABR955_06845 [Verrucomicrobiota bacterium]|jgi:hypothetical protein